jgi:chloramphenicol 3-O-phosphotransferase
VSKPRTDRLRGPVDLDVPEFETVHKHTYDLEVDMTSAAVDEAAKEVLDAFETLTTPTAFDEMRGVTT